MFSSCSYVYQKSVLLLLFEKLINFNRINPIVTTFAVIFNTEKNIHINYHRYSHASSLKLCRQVLKEVVLSHFRKKLTSYINKLCHTFPVFSNSESSGLSSVLSIRVGELDTLIILGETGFEFALNAVSTSESSLVSGVDSYNV